MTTTENATAFLFRPRTILLLSQYNNNNNHGRAIILTEFFYRPVVVFTDVRILVVQQVKRAPAWVPLIGAIAGSSGLFFFFSIYHFPERAIRQTLQMLSDFSSVSRDIYDRQKQKKKANGVLLPSVVGFRHIFTRLNATNTRASY